MKSQIFSVKLDITESSKAIFGSVNNSKLYLFQKKNYQGLNKVQNFSFSNPPPSQKLQKSKYQWIAKIQTEEQISKPKFRKISISKIKKHCNQSKLSKKMRN
jgi:hypothetical protein